VVVVVNDRGPFTKGRVLDLSLAAAKELRMMDRGLVKVTAVIE
jgi:rare lipoprotein A